MEKLIARTLAAIPEYQVFLTVAEMDASSRALAERFPDQVELAEAGRSRDGHPILHLKIGSGPRQALFYACPHPNEPIGAMTLEFLSQRLCEDPELREGFTWHIIKCIDVDGTRLNEGWFKGPFTPANYIRNFYRPASHQQVEWTFPMQYKTYTFDRPMPETQVLMRLLEQVRPDFMYSLHNAGFGGAYYYLSHTMPSTVYDLLRELPARYQVPLHCGEPEMPFCKVFSPSVYQSPYARDIYDFYGTMLEGKDPAVAMTGGACSLEYAESIGVRPLTVVTELPYFYDPRIEDQSVTGTLRKDAILLAADRDGALVGFLQRQYQAAKPHLVNATRFEEAVADFIPMIERSVAGVRQWALTNPELDAHATGAQLFDSEVLSLFYKLLYLGIFLRMVDAQPHGVELDSIRVAVGQELETRAAWLEGQLRYSVVPIRNLVAIQVGAGLAVLNECK